MGPTEMRGRLLRILLVAGALLVLWCEPALAQCAMCKESVASSTEGASAAGWLNLAVLVLLIPPVAIFAGIFGLIYRMRNVQGR
jgi:hypothetical protein